MISRYVALVDPLKLGLKVNVFVRVALEKQEAQALERFEQAVSHFDEVMEVYLMTGDEDYLLRSYVPIFKEYKGQTVEFLSATQLKRPGEFTVATKIISSDEPDILVSYRIKKDASCFQVYDMVAEGVSLLNTQRQDFGSIFARKGYAELIAILKSKVAEPTPEAK